MLVISLPKNKPSVFCPKLELNLLIETCTRNADQIALIDIEFIKPESIETDEQKRTVQKRQ